MSTLKLMICFILFILLNSYKERFFQKDKVSQNDHNYGRQGMTVLKSLKPLNPSVYATIRLNKPYIKATPGTLKFKSVKVVKRYPTA